MSQSHLENISQPERNEKVLNPVSAGYFEGSEPDLHKKIKKEDLGSENKNEMFNENQVSKEVLKSRKIHRQLIDKKSRWKPSDSELIILKKSFGSNQYPAKEDKEKLLSVLEEKFKSKIHLNQLARWFQHQRERCVRIGDSSAKKTVYKKFGKEDLKYLQSCFDQNNYPKNEEMKNIAKKLESSFSKIENWYKHNRRSLAKKGLIELKNKKYFKKDELEYLYQCFSLFPKPTKQKYLEMAKTLDCDESHLKNWYSNKRKKLKLLAKKNDLLTNFSKTDEIPSLHPRHSLPTTRTNDSSTNLDSNPQIDSKIKSAPLNIVSSSNNGNIIFPANNTISFALNESTPMISNLIVPTNEIGSRIGFASHVNNSSLSIPQSFGYAQPQISNGQAIYPRIATFVMPSSNKFPQNAMTPLNCQLIPSAYSNGESKLIGQHNDAQFQKPESTQKLQIANSSSSTKSSSTESNLSTEALKSKEKYETLTYNPANLQENQDNGTDATKSDSNSSGITISHNCNRNNSFNNAWVFPIGGQVQGGAICIPISQGITPTSAQSQVSCYFSALNPYQALTNTNYGATYYNNSYIYNNSTTYSNYNNGFSIHPNVGFSPNTILANFPPYGLGNFTSKGTQISVISDNPLKQVSINPQPTSSNQAQ